MRVTLDLSEAAVKEVSRICSHRGWTKATLFRKALTLMRIHTSCEDEREQIIIRGKDGEERQIIIPFD